MKKIKLNIAFLMAILVVGVTFTTQANFFGGRVITRCFWKVTLTNCPSTSQRILDEFAGPPQTCPYARMSAITHPYVQSASIVQSYPESPCDGLEMFCCVKLTEITPTDPGWSCAFFLNLGEGLKKYKVASSSDVYCKILL